MAHASRGGHCPACRSSFAEHERPLRRAELAERVDRLVEQGAARTAVRSAPIVGQLVDPSQQRDRRAKRYCGSGGFQRRGSRPATTSPASSSPSSKSCVPGRQRSMSSARRSGSCARRRTAPSPFHARSASGSCSLSSSGGLSLRTTSPAGTTSEALLAADGGSSSRLHCSAHSAASRGRRSSHAAPPGIPRHHERPAGSSTAARLTGSA